MTLFQTLFKDFPQKSRQKNEKMSLKSLKYSLTCFWSSRMQVLRQNQNHKTYKGLNSRRNEEVAENVLDQNVSLMPMMKERKRCL